MNPMGFDVHPPDNRYYITSTDLELTLVRHMLTQSGSMP
jgi:hypothetical protein